jgi:hypothetical protein
LERAGVRGENPDGELAQVATIPLEIAMVGLNECIVMQVCRSASDNHSDRE